jgi:hypothetical protein
MGWAGRMEWKGRVGGYDTLLAHDESGHGLGWMDGICIAIGGVG